MFACFMPALVAPKENDNDQDYFCYRGSSLGRGGRFRDFTSRTNRAAFIGRYRWQQQRRTGILLSSVLPSSSALLSSALLPPTLASLLVAARLSALLVMTALL
jgi:hypothetical protein